jgi:SSS family solute:Na+ symporter
MDLIALAVIVSYLGLTTLVGGLLAKRSAGPNQWAAGGGQMGILMVAVGIAGTRIGGVGTYGVAGDVITTGLWNMWYGVNTFLALALVGFFYAVPYRRLRLHTVAEIFGRRFGSRRCQALTSLCVQTEYLIVNILEPFVIGSILVGVTGMPFWLAVYIGAGVLITYTAMGGLWGSAVTNLIHCVVILVGLTLVFMVGVDHLGGWESVVQQVDATLATSADIESEAWWSFIGPGWMAVIAMFFSAAIHTPAASIYVNFSTAAKDEKSVLPAFLLGGAFAAAMPFLAGSIGILTLARYGESAQGSGYSLITRLATELDPLIGGVALAAVLAAVISSGGPILLSSSTMFVTDWIPNAKNWPADKKLRAFRLTTVVYGLFAATIAWRGQIGSILDLLLLGFAMVVPPAIAVGYLIYWRRTTEKGAFWGMLLGYGTGLAWYGMIRWASFVELAAPEGSGALRRLAHFLFVYRGDGIDPSYATTLIPLVAVPVISLLTYDPDDLGEDFYDIVTGQTESH